MHRRTPGSIAGMLAGLWMLISLVVIPTDAAETFSPATVSGNGEVHGNKKSKIYHLPDCPGYAGMSPASVVAFGSEAAAAQAGYRKAKNCP